MIRALITGTLYGSPQARTSAASKAYVTGKLRADAKDGAITWCSLIAFGEQAERLAALKEGAALSVSGRCEVSAWINRDGEAAGGLSVVVDELATLKGRPRPPRPRQPEAAAAGFDDAGGWRP
jgi:single-strand DNA-binding protein